MSRVTNQLVSGSFKHVLPGAAAIAVLGSALFLHESNVHAASATAAPLDDNSVAALTATDHAMEALAARVTPAVVNVAVTARAGSHETAAGEGGGEGGGEDQGENGQMGGLPPGFSQFFGQGGGRSRPQLEHGVGSGVIISSDGYIITNNHVVNGATEIRVTLNDRRVLNAKVIGVDKLTDLAVIKVAATNLPAMAWGDSTMLHPGQTVLAFGSPFGSLQFSVTKGIVSAINRQNLFRSDARQPGEYIQTDAAINPGNSGGALVNAHGELVGINVGIITNSGSFAGAGFAIPSQIAHSTATQLIAHGKVEHGYLGISLNDVTPANASFFKLSDAAGAIVAQVTPGSPASRGGLKQGDVIRQLNGQPIVNSGALQVAVSQIQPGSNASMNMLRNGQLQSINLTVGTFDAMAETAANEGDGSGRDASGARTGKLGLALSDLSSDVRQQIQAPADLHGAVVQTVRPGSPAEDAGLQAGDVILEVNRQAAQSASQFASELRGVPSGQEMLLLVWSKGNSSYITLRPQSGETQHGE